MPGPLTTPKRLAALTLTAAVVAVAIPMTAAAAAPADALSLMEGAQRARATRHDAAPSEDRAYADADTFSDDADDGFRYSGPPDPSTGLRSAVSADLPQADIRSHDVDFGETLRLSVHVDEPTDPSTTAWDGVTFVGWYLDTDGDDVGDYLVTYFRAEGGALTAKVDDITDRDNIETTCPDEDASFDQDDYVVDGVDSTCFGSPDAVAVNPAVFYDQNGDGDPHGEDIFFDIAPNEGGFEAAVQGGREEPTTDRLAGEGRVETALAISQAQFPNGADVVYLARADLFADAVVGGVLRDGPILLVPTCGAVPEAVLAEIDRLDPDRVIALGGPDAVCDQVLADAGAGRQTGRHAGPDRIATAVAISQAAFPGTATEVYLARADVFADAVAGGVLTAGPILLVPTCGSVPPNVMAEIDRLGVSRVTALGGEQAICQALLVQAASGDPQRTTGRLAGNDRFETAVAISQFQFPGTVSTVYLARADEFADAVVGGVLTAGPILLVPTCGTVPEVVLAEIRAKSPEEIVALGGSEAICDAVLEEARSA